MNLQLKLTTRQALLYTFVLITTLLAVSSCKQKSKIIKVDPAYSQFIEGYTSGVVSKRAAIMIKLNADASTAHNLGEVADKSLLEISPSVKGKASWIDSRTIEFVPEKEFERGQLYTVNFKLGKATKVPEKYKEFEFNFQIIKPSFQVKQNGLRSTGEKDKMFLPGSLETADFEDNAVVEQLLVATQNKKKLNITWQHNGDDKTHFFKVENIVRPTGKEDSVLLEWNGSPLDSKITGSKSLAVPAVGQFKVLNVEAINDQEQYASVQFSDPIAVGQDLQGLITLSEQEDGSYSINGSEVKFYTAENLEGNYTLNVNPGIKNTFDQTLTQSFVSNLLFENNMPSVKIFGHGNILPNTDKLVLPFEAVNLNAVDISIIKIYENNIPQFLQSNSLNGEESLRRVGKPIVQKTLRLDDDKTLDLRKKQRFSLDIDQYLKAEPGAIYRVTIGFRPEYSLYNCTNASDSLDEENDYWYTYLDDIDEDDLFWSRYDNYYPYGYNWEKRDNPCAKSYYNKDRWATRNIIASNIGLTAKSGNNGSLQVIVSDILSAGPLSGVDLQVLDYQNQVLAKGKSDKDGFATFDLKRRPYLLVASRGKEKGYLKLDDGSSLLLSRFDITGQEIKEGIKGFIFGERGVWRPGDSLYINFILEDKDKKLPEDHPIEFELYSPKDQLYQRMVQTNAKGGYNVFKTATSTSAPTGNWRVAIKVGGAVFEKRIKIETIMPNRLKIDWQFNGDSILSSTGGNISTLSARWLFGATAQNLKATVDASLYTRKDPFPKWKNFVFQDPTSDYYTQSKTIFSGTLNDEGKAQVKTNFETDVAAPGMLTAQLNIKVFEPGGAFSTSNLSVPYSSYTSYVGIKTPEGVKPWGIIPTGKTNQAEIINVDSKGNLLSGEHTAEVQLYRIQWRWWWDNYEGSLSNFTQDKFNKLVSTQTVSLNNGKGTYNFKIDDNNWGRYLILVKDLKSGHKTGQVVYVDQPGWQNRNITSDDPTAATMLSFTADKDKYTVGENITLNIPSSAGGKGIVSIETGSKVLKTFWIDTEKGETRFSFKAEKEMSPNIYVNVSLLQPHAQTVNDLPIRMYGVIPIMVEDKNTHLNPVIDMPGTIRPEQQVIMNVSEQSGKEMYYSIALVDEGLLDLTRFKTPDPYQYFYAREALGVKSWDLFDYVIGSWGTTLERILTIGGDENLNNPDADRKANRFKPVVKYMGPFYLKKGEKKRHDFSLPPYIGSVRAMVVAAHEGSYGNSEKTFSVKKPLMLLGTAPRVLGTKEQIKVPVSLFTMEKNMGNVTVSIKTNRLLNITGNATQTINSNTIGETLIYFDVVSTGAEGIAQIEIQAKSGKENATHTIELDVRNPNSKITNVLSQNLQGGKQWSTTVSAIGDIATAKSMLEISSVPAMNLEKRLDFLIDYPHGCVEQITAGAFPQLFLNQLVTLTEQQKTQVDRNVKSVIASLQNYQLPDGGFSYWPGGNSSDEWGTNFAGHFLLEAKERGYSVSTQMLQQWKNYQRLKAQNWTPSTTNFVGTDLVQAYRLYTLALGKSADLGAMNRLKEFKYLSVQAKWRLAAAYQLAGQTKTALQLITGLPVKAGASFASTYGSELRDEAMVLETLTLLGRKDQAYSLVTSIAAELSQEKWFSTQTTAYSLLAIAKYCGKNPSANKIDAQASINGKTIKISTTAYVSQTSIDFKNATASLNVKNNGGNMLFVRVITEGKPLTGESAPAQNNPAILTMTVNYFTRDLKPVDVRNIKQGTDFIAKVTVTNPGTRGDYKRMALTQVFPSGWEILNTRMQEGEGSFQSSPFEYRDIRDDRVNTYFEIGKNKTLTFYVQLNAAYLGKYFLPAVNCAAMYDENISARNNGMWVEVVQ